MSMSRLSFRPRAVDIHKKLPIVKSLRDLDNDDGVGVSRMVQHGHVALDSENELVLPASTRRGGNEIPTPQFVAVESYEKDYSQTFMQPTSYLRRGARNEGGEFVEYDLDDDDEIKLQELNSERNKLPADKFERMLYKLELADHKLRERTGGMPATLGIPMPVLLPKDSAIELLRSQNNRSVIAQVYEYWKAKREKWQKPVLRRLQPPPGAHDTNPFNVFRPREKIHRPHTRRMQRRENDVQSFDKLRQVRRNLEQAKALMLAVQRREEKKRELVECEGHIQRLQIKYKHESRLDDDTLLSNMYPSLTRFQRRDEMQDNVSEEQYDYSTPIMDNTTMMDKMDQLKRKRKRRRLTQGRGRPHKKMMPMENLDPVLLFTKPVEPRRLVAAGIEEAGDGALSYQFRGRMGRGGRIVFDRWNPLTRTSLLPVFQG